MLRIKHQLYGVYTNVLRNELRKPNVGAHAKKHLKHRF